MADTPTPDGLASGITVTRVFDAPRERVWREWTDPASFGDWFGGAKSEVQLASVSMDVRPGGAWRLTMYSDRGEIYWSGEYLEVVEPERLVFTIRDQPELDAYELITVVLTDLADGRTEMVFQQRGRMSSEDYKRAGEGWSTFFDRLAERLADSP
jgi:uncharacterized protein YndB with AHSA1/START domain